MGTRAPSALPETTKHSQRASQATAQQFSVWLTCARWLWVSASWC